MDDETIVCRCEDITYQEVVDTVDEGYTTLDEIKRKLRCGMGPCQGRTCMRLIARIIKEKTGRHLDEILMPASRPPEKPVPLGIFASYEVGSKNARNCKRSEQFRSIFGGKDE
ncbi:MAG: (2Fe-2S)-binding protein [Thermoplasmatales archaeon]|nr:(2Fe-2S)-binding protein [Thermoplasmatales archaeon]